MKYDMFEDIELDTDRVNKAYADVCSLLDDLYIKDADVISDFTDEIRQNMTKFNPFEHYNPTTQSIANLYHATEYIIHAVYPNALVSWNAKTMSIDVDKETYCLAVKRIAEDYDVDVDKELEKLGIKT